ncbi:NAD(+)/NADH kinase [Streptomyces sp. P38-E01]|uniref:NAD(+)/NADH kinase n=1 Tax=Streptomyces tardus TaxID=2780544 RepID=A0A949JDE1_9ACTN|nr:diacylglycerol kinase family protein [Streptomyces tardus]MBU7597851.1 NAD(+)/NADH kinase [Streptomyces tardus]
MDTTATQPGPAPAALSPSAAAYSGSPGARPTRALIVANPASGSHSETLLREVRDLCAARLDAVEVHLTTARRDATDAVGRALRRPYAPHAPEVVRSNGTAERSDGTAVPSTEVRPDLVVAVGGDGTVREVVQGMADAPAPAALALVPGGTGNSGYRMIWGDRPWADALTALLLHPGDRARLRRLDLALLRETAQLVFLGACSGVIAEALPIARTIPLHGRARYAEAFARAADAHRPYPGRVTVDGEVVHEGPTVLANVGGGRYRGGQYLVLPHSEPDDGLLDVCVIGGSVAASRVPELTRTAAHLELPDTVYARGRTIVVERLDGERLPLEHDGEYQDTLGDRATLEVRAGALWTWCPTS